jgi:ribosomal protein S6
MSETNMPAAEATSYELAFHVLPTVAEGEVTTIFQKLKDTIIKHGGVITSEEAPARFDLAYEIDKHLEGRNRKFKSAYFGWVRFQVNSAEIAAITEAVEGTKELLRHLLIKLTKAEEAHPFFFHEALVTVTKRAETIDLDAVESEEVLEEVTEDAVEEGVGEESVDKV